jgi:hypothetical protein
MLEWNNLLLSCGPCNTKKLNQPSRATVRKWLGRDIKTEQECHDEIRNKHYCWPDSSPMTYKWLRPALYYDSAGNGNWQHVPAKAAIDLQATVLSKSIATRMVCADIPHLGSNLPVAVLVDPDPASTGPQEMVDLLGLNTDGAVNTTYDRRVINRTVAWFRILATLRSVNMTGPQAEFDRTWGLLVDVARPLGFFSTWVSILCQFPDPFASGTLADRFINDAGQDYLNTNSHNLP